MVRLQKNLLLLLISMLDEPVERDINFHIIFGGDGVETNFASLNRIQFAVMRCRRLVTEGKKVFETNKNATRTAFV